MLGRDVVDRASALLGDERAAEALARLAGGESVREVAERFGTSVWCIYDLQLGRTHTHLSRAG
jgi:transposase